MCLPSAKIWHSHPFSSLDLTQEPGLYWTKEQVKHLKRIDNEAAQQFAKVSEVIPYIDAFNFPQGTYPIHDLRSVTALLFPQFYNVTRISTAIGDVGRIEINANATEQEKNVASLEMTAEKQATFYRKVLSKYNNFTLPQSLSSIGQIIGIAFGAITFFCGRLPEATGGRLW